MKPLRILGNMRSLQPKVNGRRSLSAKLLLLGATFCLATAGAEAQTCITQAKMSAAQRSELGTAAHTLASAVQAGDVGRVRAGTVAQYAGDSSQADYLVRSTGQQIGSDTLLVTQLYLLDASSRKTGEATNAEFACPLSGSASETDFSIGGLPPGRFAFAMVEARGDHPWLLAFLLQSEGGAWKMAGFYPHARAAAGHDGLWYWTSARAAAKQGKPWLAWVLFGEADQLLRPAGFVSSGNLEKLRTEQRSAAPVSLANGLSTETPLSLQGAGAVYRVTELRAQASDDGRTLNLFFRIEADPSAVGQTAVSERNVEAARALLAAHPELRQDFGNVYVEADPPGANPVVTQRPMQEIATVSR